MPHRSDWPLRRIRAGRWLLAGGMTAALIAMPVASQHDPFGIVWQTALAGSADSVRGATGRAFGLEHPDERLERAKARYAEAVEQHRAGRGARGTGALGLERRPGPLAHRLSPQETRHLIEHAWRPGREHRAGFRNHGERVRTMVELAKRLGHGAQVGALQASFGTPQETGTAALGAELAMARAELEANPEDPEAAAWVDQLEMELAVAIERALPGQSRYASWAIADLDVNDDGVVDPRDLAALDAEHVTLPAGYVGPSTRRRGDGP